ncbi:MAG: regulatory protein GemA [Pseudomonadota bacterium]
MKAAPDLNRLRRRLFAAVRELGLDEEGRKEAMFASCGKASTRDMTPADFDVVLARLRELGAGSARPKRPTELRADQRFIWVLWRLLSDKGAVQPGAAALRAFIASPNFTRKWGEAATDVRFLSIDRAQDVIEALKDMCRRHGIKLEGGW